MKIILGSKSPGRKQILKNLGYKFTVMDPNIDEKSIRHLDPKKLVKALSIAKAQKLLPKIKSSVLLITADQIVLCNQKILEKPQNKKEAGSFLRLYSKYPAKTITAITVTNTKLKKQLSGTSTATIWFSPFSSHEIKKIVSHETTLHCAGGFTIDTPIIKQHILKIRGTKDSIVGLPMALTKSLIYKVSI